MKVSFALFGCGMFFLSGFVFGLHFRSGSFEDGQKSVLAMCLGSGIALVPPMMLECEDAVHEMAPKSDPTETYQKL